MKYLRESKIFYVLVMIIALFIIIALLDQVSFIFYPLEAFFASIFTPILIALFVFYIFLPVYNLIKKKVTSDKYALPILAVIILAVFYFLVSSLLPSLLDQIRSLITMGPTLANTIVGWVEELLMEFEITQSQIYGYLNELDISLTNILRNVLDGVTTSITSMISTTISTLIILFTFPLILYYFFKDGKKFPEAILRFVPSKYKNLTGDLLSAFHYSASQYIGGRMLVCIFVAAASYISYLLIGLPNALLLGIICGIFDIIPYFGPWIGAAPAFFVALTISPFTALLVVLLIFIVQQLESYVATPFVMGKSLEMHPVTVVLLVLFANELAGLLGMILILPVYAILKGCAEVLYNYYKEYRRKKNHF